MRNLSSYSPRNSILDVCMIGVGCLESWLWKILLKTYFFSFWNLFAQKFNKTDNHNFPRKHLFFMLCPIMLTEIVVIEIMSFSIERPHAQNMLVFFYKKWGGHSGPLLASFVIPIIIGLIGKYGGGWFINSLMVSL